MNSFNKYNDSQEEPIKSVRNPIEKQRCQSEPPNSSHHVLKLDSEMESGISLDFDSSSQGKSSVEDVSLSEEGGNVSRMISLEQENRKLQAKLAQHRQLLSDMSRDQEELTTELKKVIADRNNMKANLSATNKERDILKLKCHELELRVGILQSAEKARLDVTPKKLRIEDSKTNSNLKKLGLSEDILLALPFGYATRVRSAFEKLSYDNEKLCIENEKLQSNLNKMQAESSDVKNGNDKEILAKFDQLTKEKENLLQKIEELCVEKNGTSEALQKSHREVKMMRQLLAILGKEVDKLRNEQQKSGSSLVDVLKNCAALSTLNSMPCCHPCEVNTKQKPQSANNKEIQQGLPYDMLKIRCNLLSQINTKALVKGQKPAQSELARAVSTTANIPPYHLNSQHWSQQGIHNDNHQASA